MRRHFSDVLNNLKIVPEKEYRKLYDMMCNRRKGIGAHWWEDRSYYEIFSSHFTDFDFRKTILTIQEFNEEYGCNFSEHLDSSDINDLLDLCEYFYNFAFKSKIVLRNDPIMD